MIDMIPEQIGKTYYQLRVSLRISKACVEDSYWDTYELAEESAQKYKGKKFVIITISEFKTLKRINGNEI